MAESRGPKSGPNVPGTSESAGTPERDEEATSAETLSDLEEKAKVPSGAGTASESGSRLEGASPDPPAGGGGRADGSDTGGPM